MSKTLEIGYFNSIYVKGKDFASNSPTTDRYYIEESRIKGGFNETSMDYGVRAYAVNDDYTVIDRKNAMIYSGIYNSKTGVNKLNQFPIGADITKAVDITDGSIQKLHAEDRELIILQEDKCNAAGINKDFIFTAEGQPLSTASNIVIGQIRTFLGIYGISLNPESFAVKGNRKYFTDKKRGVVLRLTRDGLTEISNTGMRGYFKNNLKNNNKLIGFYDNIKDQYVLNLQDDNKTIGFDESSKGWTSFYSYYPEAGFTLNNVLYTFKNGDIYEHYKNAEIGTGQVAQTNNAATSVGINITLTLNAGNTNIVPGMRVYSYTPSGQVTGTLYGEVISVLQTSNPAKFICNIGTEIPGNQPVIFWAQNYNVFYNDQTITPSKISFVMNTDNSVVKNFKTLAYEGTTGWSANEIKTNLDDISFSDLGQDIAKYQYNFGYDSNNDFVNILPSMFEKKENKYFSTLHNAASTAGENEILFGQEISGLKGMYLNVTLNTSENNKQELFAVSSEAVISSK